MAYTAAFAFGPLVAVGAMGLYHAFPPERRTPPVQVAVVFAIAGGVTVLIMITTQQAIFALLKDAIASAPDPAAADIYRKIRSGLNSVHYGIDVAWDVLISASVIMLGIAMTRHPMFGRIFGTLGVVFGALLLGFNIWYFPIPPAGADSIDFGPLVALWILVAFVLLLRVGFRNPPTLTGQAADR